MEKHSSECGYGLSTEQNFDHRLGQASQSIDGDTVWSTDRPV